MYPWSSKRALVTGGASFIGSTLVNALLDRGATVRVADDFSSGSDASISARSRAVRPSSSRAISAIPTWLDGRSKAST